MSSTTGEQVHLPPCPACRSKSMVHRCISHAVGTRIFNRNGWYCRDCNSGPYQLRPPQSE